VSTRFPPCVRAFVVATTVLVSTLSEGHAQSDTTRDTTQVIRLQPITVVGVGEAVQTATFLEWALKLQPDGVNALEPLNRAPGFNFTAGDAHGFYEYAQNTQMRVFNSQQLAMTLDGIPLGSQSPAGGSPIGRFVENESVEQVTVHQGSGNIETMSSTGLGGAIEYTTTRPKRDASGEIHLTGGRYDTRRGYARFDTGELGNGTSMYGSFSYNEFNKWRSLGDQVRTHFEAKIRQDFDGGFVSVNAYFNKRDDHDFLDVTVDQFNTFGRSLDLAQTFVVLPDKAAQVDQNALFYDAWSNGREDFLLGFNLDFQPAEHVSVAAVPYFQNQHGVGTWLPDYRPGIGTDDPLAVDNRDQMRNTWRETQYGTNRFGLTSNVTVALTEAHSVTVGGWAEHQERMQRRVWFDIPDNDTYDASTIRDEVTPIFTQFDRDFTTNTYSGFVKGNFQVAPALRVNAGVRAHAYKINFFDSQGQASSQLDDAVAFLPQVGLVYDLG